MAELLQRNGSVVHCAQDAEAGLDLAEKLDVALVLVDGDMAGMNGLEWLRQLRCRYRCVPVVMVTADHSPGLSSRVRAEGGQGFVSKTAPGLIVRIVNEILGRQSGTAATGIYLPAVRRTMWLLPIHPILDGRPDSPERLASHHAERIT